jgi:outer membrane biosynthesis protein TonB
MAHNTTHTELQQSAITKEGEFQSNSPAITQTTPIEATSDATTPITAIAETTSNPPTETIIATTTTTTITTTTVDVPSPSPPPPPPSPPPPSPPPPSPPSHPPSPPPPPPPEPKPELTTTTTQDIVTTTAEAPVQTHQPAPTEAITTELAPTYPIETSYIESIYAAPTMAASGSVSPADGLPIGSSVNTKSVSSTTATTTSDCIPSNQEGVCSTTDLASNTMSSGQIAGIAAGAAVFVLLLGACLFIVIRRRRRKNKNRCSKKVSPFFSMNDQEKQTTSNENNSRAVLCQDAIMPEMSESVYGDNLFYSDSADYRRTSSIMNHHAYLPHSTDSQLAVSFCTKTSHLHDGTLTFCFSIDANFTISSHSQAT